MSISLYSQRVRLQTEGSSGMTPPSLPLCLAALGGVVQLLFKGQNYVMSFHLTDSLYATICHISSQALWSWEGLAFKDNERMKSHS